MTVDRPPARGISSYRALPRRAGWSFLVATSLGRLPMSMVPLAILTLATAATGSLAIGGFAAAATALGEAVGAPVSGSLADRFGQRVVVLAEVALHLSFLIGFALGAGVLPDSTTIAFAGLAGLTLPQVGALSRARWLAIAPDDLPAAFAFEGVVDETVYIFGPAAVGIAATLVSPQAAIVVAGSLVALFATQFAVHPTQARVPRRIRRERTDPTAPVGAGRARRAVLVGLIFAGMLSMGVFFGGSQTGLTAFAEEIGIPGAGALLYAVMAVGSAGTTLAMVLLPERIGPWARWTVAAIGMTGGAVLLLFATDVPTVVLAAILAGAFQGPLLLTIFSVAGSLAEAGRAGVLMTLTASGVVVGLGIGSAVTGPLAQEHGPVGGFGAVVAASALLLLLGAAAGAVARARTRHGARI